MARQIIYITDCCGHSFGPEQVIELSAQIPHALFRLGGKPVQTEFHVCRLCWETKLLPLLEATPGLRR